MVVPPVIIQVMNDHFSIDTYIYDIWVWGFGGLWIHQEHFKNPPETYKICGVVCWFPKVSTTIDGIHNQLENCRGAMAMESMEP